VPDSADSRTAQRILKQNAPFLDQEAAENADGELSKGVTISKQRFGRRFEYVLEQMPDDGQLLFEAGNLVYDSGNQSFNRWAAGVLDRFEALPVDQPLEPDMCAWMQHIFVVFAPAFASPKKKASKQLKRVASLVDDNKLQFLPTGMSSTDMYVLLRLLGYSFGELRLRLDSLEQKHEVLETKFEQHVDQMEQIGVRMDGTDTAVAEVKNSVTMMHMYFGVFVAMMSKFVCIVFGAVRLLFARTDVAAATAVDASEKINALGTKVDTLEAKTDVRFEQTSESVDALDAKTDAIDAKTDAIDAKTDAIDAKHDAKHSALHAKTDKRFANAMGKVRVMNHKQDAENAAKYGAKLREKGEQIKDATLLRAREERTQERIDAAHMDALFGSSALA